MALWSHDLRYAVRQLTILGGFAFVAFVLAIGGVYAVVSRNVATRTREIGLRISLGATRGEVLLMVIRQGLAVVAVGVAIGVGAAVLMTKVLSGLLYGIATTDTMTFVSTTALLSAAAALAIYVPARRAARVDPLMAIRCD